MCSKLIFIKFNPILNFFKDKKYTCIYHQYQTQNENY